MNKMKTTMKILMGLCVLACVAMTSRAQALTLTFDCQIVSSLTPDNCVLGGTGPGANPSFGTLTLTDSVIDPNRVDISWNLTPQWGTNISRVLLNYNAAFPTNHSILLVDQSAPAGSTTNISGTTHTFGNNTQSIGTTYGFDIRVNEAAGGGLTFAGSLALRNDIGGAFVNLDANTSFSATSTNGSGATPPLYAAYTTFQPGTVPPGWTTSNGTEFWAGATVIPEPGTALLLAMGLAGLGFAGRLKHS